MTATMDWRPLLAVLLVQLVLQSWFFPVTELLTAKPLIHIDAAFHQYQIALAQALCHQHLLVGYDPYFAAGYQGGVTFNASAKVPALLACALGTPAAVAPVYKVFSFTMGVLAPAGLVLAARLLGLSRAVGWVVAAMAVLLWWTGPIRWYHTAGLVSWVASAFLALPYAVAAVRGCLRPTFTSVVAMAAVGALGTLLHPLFPLAVLILAVPLLLASWREVRSGCGFVTAALCICAAVLAVNGPWLLATMNAPGYASQPGPHQWTVDPLLMLRELLGVASTAAGGSRLDAALVLGCAAFLVLARGTVRKPVMAVLVGGALLMAWASLGGLLKSASALQPNRFSALAWLALSLPAAWGAVALAGAVRSRSGPPRWLACSVLAAISLIGLAFVREAAIEIFTTRSGRYAVTPPEVKGLGSTSQAVLSFLRDHTDTSARVYFEASLGRRHDGGHMAGLYALQADREFIGGPYPFIDYANAWDGWAFGQRLTELSSAQLQQRLDMYNVKWMLCHTAACRQAMAALPGVTLITELGVVTAFQRAQAGNFFAQGRGRVTQRCFNTLELETEGDTETTLKYHWVPGLVTSPPTTVEQRDLLPGARPFIVLRNPPRHLTLSLGLPAARCAQTPIPG